jgi:anti-sigma-K factor RskA
VADEHALLGPYLLDALDEIDRARFERHLDSCESCADEVTSMRGTVAALGSPLADEPPAQLRERVLTAAANTRQEAPAVEVRPGRRRRWVAALAGAVAAVALVAGGVWWQQRDDDHLTAQQVLASDVEVHRMETEMGMVKVGMSHESGMIAVDGSALATPAPMVYRLWFYTPDGPVSAGLLDDQGSAVVPMRKGSLVLTMEPAGGGDRPAGNELFEMPVTDL